MCGVLKNKFIRSSNTDLWWWSGLSRLIVSLLYEWLPYQLFLIPNTVHSSLYIIMMIEQYCFIKLLLNWCIFYFLYCSAVILDVFVLFDVLSHIHVPPYKSSMFCLMYVCDLLHAQLSWDKRWICEMYVYVSKFFHQLMHNWIVLTFWHRNYFFNFSTPCI